MHLVILKGETESPTTLPSTLKDYEDEWERRGAWLIRHHKRPRRKTYHPNWRSSELSPFDVEPYKA
eukprot:3040008-Prorocentrum_lima.AAC.1